MSAIAGGISTQGTGWFSATLEAWTYASATTITVPTDATTRYDVGDRIRLKQGAGYLYFVVVAVTATLLTITGGSDYILANAAITNQDYSPCVQPLGFPAAFNYTVTPTGFSVNPVGILGRFSVHGRTVSLSIRMPAAGTSNATTMTVSLPITAATLANQAWGNLWWTAADNSAGLTNGGRVTIQSAGTVATADKDAAGAAWTASGTKSVSFEIWYDI